MANAIRGQVPFKVGDDDYVLQFDVNRLVEIEGLLGQSTGETWPKIEAGDFKVLRAYLWGGLKAHDLSLSECGELATTLTPIETRVLISAAMAKAFPKPAAPGGDDDADPTRKAAEAVDVDGTGKSS